MKGFYIDEKELIQEFLNEGLSKEDAEKASKIIITKLPIKVFPESLEIDVTGESKITIYPPALTRNFKVEIPDIDPFRVLSVKFPELDCMNKEREPFCLDMKVYLGQIPKFLRKYQYLSE